DDLLRLRARETEPGDAIVGARGEVHVDEAVLGVRRRNGQPEQPALTAGRDAGDLRDLHRLGARAQLQNPAAHALGDQRAAVRQEPDAPRDLETARDDAGPGEVEPARDGDLRVGRGRVYGYHAAAGDERECRADQPKSRTHTAALPLQ